MAGHRFGSHALVQSIRDNGHQERGNRGSRRAVATSGGPSPSVVSDAPAMRSAERDAVQASFALVRGPGVCSDPAAVAERTAAVDGRALAGCSGLVFVVAPAAAAACSGSAAAPAAGLAAPVVPVVAVAACAAAATADYAAVVAEHAAVARAVVAACSVPCSAPLRGGLAFPPRAGRKQEQRFPAAKTDRRC
jgi:hypothetical protein